MSVLIYIAGETLDPGDAVSTDGKVVARQSVQSIRHAKRLYELVVALRRASRTGSDSDSPEGSRTVTLSDTFTNEMANTIDSAADCLMRVQEPTTFPEVENDSVTEVM